MLSGGELLLQPDGSGRFGTRGTSTATGRGSQPRNGLESKNGIHFPPVKEGTRFTYGLRHRMPPPLIGPLSDKPLIEQGWSAEIEASFGNLKANFSARRRRFGKVWIVSEHGSPSANGRACLSEGVFYHGGVNGSSGDCRDRWCWCPRHLGGGSSTVTKAEWIGPMCDLRYGVGRRRSSGALLDTRATRV